MESHKPNFESIESVTDKLVDELGFFQNGTDFFHNFARKLKKDESFQVNFDQLVVLSRAFVQDITVEDDRSMKAFLIGGLFGYKSLSCLDIDNINQDVYTAVGSFMADARMEVNKKIEREEDDVSESFRNYLISEELNNRLKNDLSFEAVDEREMHLIYNTLKDVTKNENHRDFAFKGYTFIRGILIWQERHKLNLMKKYLRSVNESEFDNERSFFEIISDVEINPDLADGKEDCEKELQILKNYFKRLNRHYKPKQDMDDEVLHDILIDMESDVMKLMYTFNDLALFNRFTFEGPNLILIADDRTRFTRLKTFGENSVLDATVVDVEVRVIPNQEELDNILLARSNKKEYKFNEKLYRFGIVFQLQDAVVIDYDGSVTTFPKHSNIYVPVEYKDTRILKHLFEGEEDNFQDTGDYDDYETDDD